MFEDIAIATYLLVSAPPSIRNPLNVRSTPQVLWEKERKELSVEKKQTFVDLGCGNGLLVYLLTSEGVREGRGGREKRRGDRRRLKGMKE